MAIKGCGGTHSDAYEQTMPCTCTPQFTYLCGLPFSFTGSQTVVIATPKLLPLCTQVAIRYWSQF